MAEFKSPLGSIFKNQFSEDIFRQKYQHERCETWESLSKVLVEDVCEKADHRFDYEKEAAKEIIGSGKFFPGGRYLYYAGRELRAYNNCYLLLPKEDSREDWADLSYKAELCLANGGGIGASYSIYRSEGEPLKRTGGVASGPIPKMMMINRIGSYLMQGGSRRSAIYASLNWRHGDIQKFLHSKDWYNMPVAGTDKSMGELKEEDFNFECPLDMTNISTEYDTKWLMEYWTTGKYGEVFLKNCKQALATGEPGFSFNFFDKEREVGRNACTEITTSDDSDVCNLGSINMAAIPTIEEFYDVVKIAVFFLLNGTLTATLPYDKVRLVREKNRRLGLGLMGLHEWLVQRGYRYEMVSELHKWLTVYRDASRAAADQYADLLGVSHPIAVRAIAPTGSIGILAGTSTGIEPVFAVAYKRRYLKGTRWHYQYVIDSAAKSLIERYGVNPNDLECALDLAQDYERRIKFQANIQDYVDHAISSTINLPKWGTEHNNESKVEKFAKVLADNAHRIRGFTCYPDGSRGGQPLTTVEYKDALSHEGHVYEEVVDVCDITNRGGTCGS